MMIKVYELPDQSSYLRRIAYDVDKWRKTQLSVNRKQDGGNWNAQRLVSWKLRNMILFLALNYLVLLMLKKMNRNWLRENAQICRIVQSRSLTLPGFTELVDLLIFSCILSDSRSQGLEQCVCIKWFIAMCISYLNNCFNIWHYFQRSRWQQF